MAASGRSTRTHPRGAESRSSAPTGIAPRSSPIDGRRSSRRSSTSSRSTRSSRDNPGVSRGCMAGWLSRMPHWAIDRGPTLGLGIDPALPERAESLSRALRELRTSCRRTGSSGWHTRREGDLNGGRRGERNGSRPNVASSSRGGRLRPLRWLPVLVGARARRIHLADHGVPHVPVAVAARPDLRASRHVAVGRVRRVDVDDRHRDRQHGQGVGVRLSARSYISATILLLYVFNSVARRPCRRRRSSGL